MLAIAVVVVATARAENAPEPSGSMWSAARRAEYRNRQDELRADLRVQLGIPETKIDLVPESRGLIERDGIVVEKWIISAESGYQRGQSLPDLGLRPFSGSELAVLQPDELGRPQYTIDGWLDSVELARNEQK